MVTKSLDRKRGRENFVVRIFHDDSTGGDTDEDEVVIKEIYDDKIKARNFTTKKK